MSSPKSTAPKVLGGVLLFACILCLCAAVGIWFIKINVILKIIVTIATAIGAFYTGFFAKTCLTGSVNE